MATVWDMLASSEATAAETVGAFTDVLRVETVETVAEPCLELALTAAQRWAPEPERVGLEAQVAAAARRLVDDRRRATRRAAHARPDGRGRGGPRRGARARPATTSTCSGTSWRAAPSSATWTPTPCGPCRTATPTPTRTCVRSAVRASSPSAEAKEEAWTALVERRVPIQTARTVATAFWRPGQDHVLAPYAERYVEALPTLHEGGMIPGLALTASLFPVFAIDEA